MNHEQAKNEILKAAGGEKAFEAVVLAVRDQIASDLGITPTELTKRANAADGKKYRQAITGATAAVFGGTREIVLNMVKTTK